MLKYDLIQYFIGERKTNLVPLEWKGKHILSFKKPFKRGFGCMPSNFLNFSIITYSTSVWELFSHN